VTGPTIPFGCKVVAEPPRDDFGQYDGLGLAELIRKKEVSPDEVLGDLERIDTRNPAVNPSSCAWTSRHAGRSARPAGRAVQRRPYLLKDLGVLYTGTITSFAAALRQLHRDHDSEIVARLKRAGS